ncbi:hypothetical protein [Bacteroides acidifaciens]|uniref:hypothetical protein n=1 Tax=Bacteroides acidifaciens TaxID=85831 RepID=UPI0025A9C77B|nr:hypothetical protein [Bacteroides acidifaciens]
MTTHLLWAFIVLIITGCTTRTDISLPVNEIKQGVAEVTIKVNDQSEIMSAKDIVGEVYWKPLLDYNYVDTVNLIPEPAIITNGTGLVPMETLYRDAVSMIIRTTNGQDICHLNIGLSQSSPQIITLNFNADGKFLNVDVEGGTGRSDISGQYGRIFEAYGSSSIGTKEIWEDSEKFLNWQLEKEMKENISAVKAAEISDVERRWITRALERDYCLTRIVPYKERALTFGVDFANVDSSKIIAPECSFYRFLNNLDYSTDMLNDFPLGLRREMNAILRVLLPKIQFIGETPVEEWKRKAIKELKGIIDNPTPLLLNLLVATAYLQQIQGQNQPLTDVQIANIKSAFVNDDLGKIILSRNANPYPNVNQNIIWQ